MAFSGENLTITAVTCEDLSNDARGLGHVYKVFNDVGGIIGATELLSSGILQNTAEVGGQVSYAYSGVSKYIAGGAVARGALLVPTTSGYLITATATSSYVGRAVTAVGTGEVGVGVFAFPNRGLA